MRSLTVYQNTRPSNMKERSCHLLKLKFLFIFWVSFGLGYLIGARILPLTDNFVTHLYRCRYHEESFVLSAPHKESLLFKTKTPVPTVHHATQSLALSPTMIADKKTTSTEVISKTVRNACKPKDLDPFDPTISKLIEHPTGIDCYKVQPYLTLIDDDGYFGYNTTEQLILENQGVNFTCQYWTFGRKPGKKDDEIGWDNGEWLMTPVKLEKDMVDVRCNDENGTQIYWNVHAFPAQQLERQFAEPTNDQLSLLFFLVDSASYSVLQRNMPLSYNYTKNVMGVKFFKSFNKIGSNSYPNQMAMLTGQRVYWEQNDMPREVPNNYDELYFDTWPLVWKYFKAKSYATMFNEDWPYLGLFNQKANGFTKPPTDFYYHHLWIAIDKATHKNSSWYCFSNEPIPKVNIDLTRHHMTSLKDKLQFVYSVVSETTHAYDNEIQRLDEYVLDFFKRLYEADYFNKTVVIFASDHGVRAGKIRSSHVGSLEERLPFFGLWFPPWFYELHPNIKTNVENNLDQLSASFDVYETMKDIANANWNGEQRKAGSRGLSQLYPLPNDRTCKEAGIPDHYCSCNEETQEGVNQTITDAASTYLVDYLNYLLRNLQDKCQKIKLQRVNFIKRVKDQMSSSSDSEETNEVYLIGIQTNPFNAAFETMLTVYHNGTDYVWDFKGDIYPTNLWSGISDCVKDNFYLRQFCPCYDGKAKYAN